MVAQAVEAIWIFKYNASAFRATYRRFNDGSGGNTFTKDYLQVGGDCKTLLAKAFDLSEAPGAQHPISYIWPGGSSDGFLSFSADRYHMAWAINDSPLPWRLTTSPSAVSVETIPGDPSHSTQIDAEAEWTALEARGLEPYLVAVKLRGESDRLHIRAFLDNPPAGMEWAAFSHVPQAVRDAAASLGNKKGCASLEVDGGMTAPPDVAKLLHQLEDNPNILLVGPPGTGKTVLLDNLTHFVENGAGGLYFDPALNHDAISDPSFSVPGKTRTVVLHPSYAYENLVVGLLPEPAPSGGISVKPVPGPLVSLAQYAANPNTRALLVLDEFNRGNAAAVLGDTLALLDKDKRGTSRVNLPYADVNVPAEYAHGTETLVPDDFTLPPNLWIVAAMNSSDRSVAPLDAALRRRFSIVEMPPNYAVLAQHLGADEDADFERDSDDWTPGTVASLAVELLRALNKRLDAVLGTDFRLGQSNFWSVSGDTGTDTIASLAAAFDFRIVSTLRLAMQDDDGALAAVLRAGTAEAPLGGQDSVAYWKGADPELGTYASSRLHVRELSTQKPELALQELIRQAEQ